MQKANAALIGKGGGFVARWAHLPYGLIEKVSNCIINEIENNSRVAYDVSSKAPATIEWDQGLPLVAWWLGGLVAWCVNPATARKSCKRTNHTAESPQTAGFFYAQNHMPKVIRRRL